MLLANKKVVLTGASGGIGTAIAKALAAEGCNVLVVGRNTGKLSALLSVLEGSGHQLLAVDLASRSGRAMLLKQAEAFQVDILINGLGSNQLSLLETSEEGDIDSIIATNLLIPIQLCRAIGRLLNDRKDTAIVNIGSILGSIGYAGSSVYCASKFGLRGFTESLHRELADKPVSIIYFAPRATNTEMNSDEMQQLNKALGNAVDEPVSVASALIATLRHGNRSAVYLGRAERFFVMLNSLVPRLVDKVLASQLPVIQRYASSTDPLTLSNHRGD